MKKTFATGLIILLPFAITAFIVLWLIDLMTDPFTHFVEHFFARYTVISHKALIGFFSRATVLIFLVAFIFLLGFFGRRFFFHQLVSLSQKIITKIPVVKTIYNILSETTKAMLKPGQKAFKETVLIPFPHKDTHALGLVTGSRPESLSKVLTENNLSVFIPTAPHPISGYILFTSKEHLIEVPFTTEETFTFLISCGMTHPPEHKSPSPSP